MAWRFSDAPDQIGKEVRENLATGDFAASNPDWSYADGVWSRDGGGTLVLADGDPFTAYTFEPDATYTLSAEVLADTEATIGWGMSLELNGEQIVIGDAGVDVGETVPGGEWVTASKEWRSPDGGAVGSAAFYASAPGVVRVRNVSVAEQTGRVVLTVPGDVLAETIMASGGIVAGTPGGARVELAEDGLVAYDAAGTQTAHIAGEGGEFVGGTFRTSDALPGQVTLSDTANRGAPGIAVEPDDSTGYDVLPSIGPGPDDMHISGGVSTAGAIAGAQFSANGTTIYHNSPGETGAGSWVVVNGAEARLAYRPDRTTTDHESGVWVRPFGASVFSEDADGYGFISASSTRTLLAQWGPGDALARAESSVDASPERIVIERKPGGVPDRHRLTIDDDGVWVQTVLGANPVSYNLLETAQDSGWVAFAPVSGITANNTSWRNKGGIMWFRGFVTATWASGWNLVRAGFATTEAPVFGVERPAWNVAGVNYGVRMRATGDLEVYCPSAGSATIRLDGLNYPTT